MSDVKNFSQHYISGEDFDFVSDELASEITKNNINYFYAGFNYIASKEGDSFIEKAASILLKRAKELNKKVAFFGVSEGFEKNSPYYQKKGYLRIHNLNCKRTEKRFFESYIDLGNDIRPWVVMEINSFEETFSLLEYSLWSNSAFIITDDCFDAEVSLIDRFCTVYMNDSCYISKDLFESRLVCNLPTLTGSIVCSRGGCDGAVFHLFSGDNSCKNVFPEKIYP